MSCSICNRALANECESFDIKRTLTEYSKENIEEFIERELKVILLGNSICTLCHGVINELDLMHRRCKELADRLRQSFQRKNQENVEIANEEPIFICNEEELKSKEQNNDVGGVVLEGNVNHKIGPSKPYKCTICSKRFKRAYDIRMHMLSHTNISPFICEICGKTYKHKKALQIHVDMHNGIHKFSCTYCNKAFTLKKGLQRHLPIHTG